MGISRCYTATKRIQGVIWICVISFILLHPSCAIETTTAVASPISESDQVASTVPPPIESTTEQVISRTTQLFNQWSNDSTTSTYDSSPAPTSAHVTHDATPPPQHTTLEDFSKECDDLTEKERATVVRFQIRGENLTGPGKWYQDSGVQFREIIASRLSKVVNVTVERKSFAYVRRSGREQVSHDTLELYIFVRNEWQFSDQEAISLLKIVRDSLHSNNTSYKLVDGSLKSGIPWPDCNSLFYEYLPLWIVLMVTAFLLVVGSVVLTWYCWKRGKSVDLKTEMSASELPKQELSESSLSGQDNPALVIANERPSKKKRAPQLPVVPPAENDQYDTGIVPYDEQLPTPNGTSTPVNNNGVNSGTGNGIVHDTKL